MGSEGQKVDWWRPAVACAGALGGSARATSRAARLGSARSPSAKRVGGAPPARGRAGVLDAWRRQVGRGAVQRAGLRAGLLLRRRRVRHFRMHLAQRVDKVLVL